MPEQEHKNRQFAKVLAEICLYYGMDKIPIVLLIFNSMNIL